MDPKTKLLHVLKEMPDEAFGYLVVMVAGGPEFRGSGQVWPDGTGGFMPESRAAIEAARHAAMDYMKGKGR